MTVARFEPVRIGVAGVGCFGLLHALTVQGLAEAELVAITRGRIASREPRPATRTPHAPRCSVAAQLLQRLQSGAARHRRRGAATFARVDHRRCHPGTRAYFTRSGRRRSNRQFDAQVAPGQSRWRSGRCAGHRAPRPAASTGLQDGLSRLGVDMLTPGEPDALAGILAFRHPRADDIYRRLHEQNIHIMCHAGRLRVAIHGYNTAEDVKRFLGALQETLNHA